MEFTTEAKKLAQKVNELRKDIAFFEGRDDHKPMVEEMKALRKKYTQQLKNLGIFVV